METVKEQETKAILELAKKYQMALEEIQALRKEIGFLCTQLYNK